MEKTLMKVFGIIGTLFLIVAIDALWCKTKLMKEQERLREELAKAQQNA